MTPKTASLEWSRKLWELGIVFNESYFLWSVCDYETNEKSRQPHIVRRDSVAVKSTRLYFPAPLTDELVEVLPRNIRVEGKHLILYICLPPECGCTVYYKPYKGFNEEYSFTKKELPDALAAMLCQLTETGVVKP